jgi:hypothetical protein
MGSISLDNVTLISVCGDIKFLLKIIKAAKYCMKQVNFAKVKILSNMVVHNNDIEIIKIPRLNQEQYSHFCLYELPKYVETDYCLTFQGDGFIINSNLWNPQFLDYDYIGAPWTTKARNQVGNGGFSLRSQKFLHSAKTLEYNSKIQFIKDIKPGQLVTPEDWFVCCYSYDEMTSMGVKFPDIKLAYEFSVEHPSNIKNYDRYDVNTYNSFGFHGSFNFGAMKLLEDK